TELSTRAVTRMTEEFIVREGIRPLHLDLEIRRQEFQDLIRDLLDGTLKSINLALDDASLKPEDIQRVLLVGGSTRIPAVWELIRKSMGREPHADINPEEAVALGAAIQAAIIDGAPVDSVLVDIAPHSLGVEFSEVHNGVLVTDLYQVMIRRNTTIPATASMAFYTLTPDQDSVEIRVYQGSDPQASRNTSLGRFEFTGITPSGTSRRGREFIIQFDYDLDGIVNVSAFDRRSGKKEVIEVHTVRGGPTRRRDLCFSPKDPSAEIKLKEVESLIERASRLEKRLDEEGDATKVNRLHELTQQLSLETEKGNLTAAGSAISDLYNLVYDLE
ncbi:MAG: Hsp70 family protein, partial [Planctomycetota bacterium]|nr:Hsp70 family protein [Planctomycetota bacterium]